MPPLSIVQASPMAKPPQTKPGPVTPVKLPRKRKAKK